MDDGLKKVLESFTIDEIQAAIIEQQKALNLMQIHMDKTQEKISILTTYISDNNTGLGYPK